MTELKVHLLQASAEKLLMGILLGYMIKTTNNKTKSSSNKFSIPNT